MSPRTGRPKAENPKDIQLKIRADEKTMQDLDFCCERLIRKEIPPLRSQHINI